MHPEGRKPKKAQEELCEQRAYSGSTPSPALSAVAPQSRTAALHQRRPAAHARQQHVWPAAHARQRHVQSVGTQRLAARDQKRKGAPRGSFLSHLRLPATLGLDTIVLRAAMGPMAASEPVVAGLAGQRSLLSRESPHHVALGCQALLALASRHRPHLLRRIGGAHRRAPGRHHSTRPVPCEGPDRRRLRPRPCF